MQIIKEDLEAVKHSGVEIKGDNVYVYENEKEVTHTLPGDEKNPEQIIKEYQYQLTIYSIGEYLKYITDKQEYLEVLTGGN